MAWVAFVQIEKSCLRFVTGSTSTRPGIFHFNQSFELLKRIRTTFTWLNYYYILIYIRFMITCTYVLSAFFRSTCGRYVRHFMRNMFYCSWQLAVEMLELTHRASSHSHRLTRNIRESAHCFLSVFGCRMHNAHGFHAAHREFSHFANVHTNAERPTHSQSCEMANH